MGKTGRGHAPQISLAENYRKSNPGVSRNFKGLFVFGRWQFIVLTLFADAWVVAGFHSRLGLPVGNRVNRFAGWY